jgi:hypothetical protein
MFSPKRLKEEAEQKHKYLIKEDSFHQQTGLKFKEETSKVLHLEHSFLWC